MAKKKVVKPVSKPKTKPTKTPKSPRKKPDSKPKLKFIPKPLTLRKVDYDIAVDEGNLSDSHEIFRVKVILNGVEVNSIGESFISCGFGQTRQKAVEDFISRNNSNILNKIFDKEEK